MSILDDIAAALRARTKTRVYGTPFADQKLQQLEQEAASRDISNQQAAFNLEEDQQMAPLRMEAQKALTGSREAAAAYTGAKTEGVEYENSDEYRAHKKLLADMKLQFALSKDEREKAKLGPEIALLEARTQRALRPPAAPKESFGTIQTQDAEGNPVTYRINNRTNELVPFTLPGGESQGPLAPKPGQQEAANSQYFKSSLGALDELDRSIDAFANAKGPQAKAEALRSYQAQLALIGNILGKASGDQRVGDKERPVYSQIAGETSTWVNLYDPTIAKRRTQEARKFLTQIAPARNPYAVGSKKKPTNDADPLGILN